MKDELFYLLMFSPLPALRALRFAFVGLLGGLTPSTGLPRPPADGVVLSCQPQEPNVFVLTLTNASPRPIFYNLGLSGSTKADSQDYVCLITQLKDNTSCSSLKPYLMYHLNARDSLTLHYRIPRDMRFPYVKFRVSYHEASAGSANQVLFTRAFALKKP